MIDGLPLLILIFVVMLVLVAYWRLVLMVFAAAFLTVMAVGVIDLIGWLGDVL
jgi:hypothetical protein